MTRRKSSLHWLPKPKRRASRTATIYEELAEIAVARGDKAAAAPWAAKAYALLKDDEDLKANDAARLQRLAELGNAQAKAP